MHKGTGAQKKKSSTKNRCQNRPFLRGGGGGFRSKGRKYRGLINHLTCWKVNSGKGGVQWSATQNKPEAVQKQQHKHRIQEKQQKNKTKAQTTRFAQAVAGCAKTAAHTAPKTQTQTTKTTKSAARTRGPRKAGLRRSLCALNGVFSWNLGGVFDVSFFEMPVFARFKVGDQS